MGIRRHYVTLGRRRVHFRAGGEGPVALLLHQSPQSSAAMMPLAEKLRSRYCVVAPDSPGFGLSDPLAVETPTIENIADALHEFAEALGLPPAAVIGVHTGAEIALEFALRHPERVGFLILDGLALFTAAEGEDILRHYLPPFTPRWDGSHLTWLWARLREQTIFFPWYKKDPAARLAYNMPPADYLHGWFMDFMYAGDQYRGGYGAAFRYRNSAAIKYVISPTAALYRTGDVLEAHQSRLPPLPDHVWAETVPPGPDELGRRVMALLDERVLDKQPAWHYRPAAPGPFPPARGGAVTPAGGDARDVVSSPPSSGVPGPEPGYLDIGEAQLAIVTAGDPAKPLLLALHDLAGSAQAARELIAAAAVDHHVVCPDLPGHGESADLAAGGFSLEKTTATLTELLARTGRDSCHLLGLGAGCVLIPPLLSAAPGPSLRAAMHNPLLLDAEARAALQDSFAPPITPDDYGLFLAKLWYALRDGRLFWPWYEPLAANIRQHPPNLAPEVIHQALFDALRCGDRYAEIWQAFFATDFIGAMQAASVPLSITLSKTHPCLDNAQAALASLPEGACHETTDHWRDILNIHFPP